MADNRPPTRCERFSLNEWGVRQLRGVTVERRGWRAMALVVLVALLCGVVAWWIAPSTQTAVTVLETPGQNQASQISQLLLDETVVRDVAKDVDESPDFVTRNTRIQQQVAGRQLFLYGTSSTVDEAVALANSLASRIAVASGWSQPSAGSSLAPVRVLDAATASTTRSSGVEKALLGSAAGVTALIIGALVVVGFKPGRRLGEALTDRR